MPFIEIDTSKWPTKGLKRGAPTVSIRENGQIALSTATAEALKGCKDVYVRVDSTARIVQLQGVDGPVKGKEKSCLHLAWPKKGAGVSFSFSRGLAEHFSDYNVAASGNQTLDEAAVKLNLEKKLVQFVVPKGTLTPREKKARKPRKAKVAVPVAAAVAADAVDDDLTV